MPSVGQASYTFYIRNVRLTRDQDVRITMTFTMIVSEDGLS
jgi:hypothetical protein